jgi:CBS domain-containing protein
VFAAIALMQMAVALQCRGTPASLWTIRPFGNRLLNAALLIEVLALLAFVYAPPVYHLLGQHPLTLAQWLSFRDLVRLLRTHHVSALPVVDSAGRVVGIVSESDLYLKQITPLRRPTSHLLERRRRRGERAKAGGATAAELMTTPVVTIGRHAPLGEAAERMHDHGVKRLPVVNDVGVLVGIVTRGDLLTAYLRADQALRAELTEQVLPQVLERAVEAVQVQVVDGVVRLAGRLTRRSQTLALAAKAQAIDGVVTVNSCVDYDVDDTSDWVTHARLPLR